MAESRQFEAFECCLLGCLIATEINMAVRAGKNPRGAAPAIGHGYRDHLPAGRSFVCPNERMIIVLNDCVARQGQCKAAREPGHTAPPED